MTYSYEAAGRADAAATGTRTPSPGDHVARALSGVKALGLPGMAAMWSWRAWTERRVEPGEWPYVRRMERARCRDVDEAYRYSIVDRFVEGTKGERRVVASGNRNLIDKGLGVWLTRRQNSQAAKVGVVRRQATVAARGLWTSRAATGGP